MSSLSVGNNPGCSTSASTHAFSSLSRQSPTTSTKSDGGIVLRNSANKFITKLEEENGTNKSGLVTGFMSFTVSFFTENMNS